jgi:hypothetical protein
METPARGRGAVIGGIVLIALAGLWLLLVNMFFLFVVRTSRSVVLAGLVVAVIALVVGIVILRRGLSARRGSSRTPQG